MSGHKNNNVILLLTCCVDPKGMAHTAISNRETRIKQYYEAFDFYLERTNYKMLIVENTLFNIDEKYLNNNRIEYLTFDGNNFDKNLGKGYGEALIIEHAINNSRFLDQIQSKIVVKITGRVKVVNIKTLIESFVNRNIGREYISADLNVKTTFAYSYFFIASLSFLNHFLRDKHLLNDSENFYFEHLLMSKIKNRDRSKFIFLPLSHPIEMIGLSGSTGNKYETKTTLFYSIIYKIKIIYTRLYLK